MLLPVLEFVLLFLVLVLHIHPTQSTRTVKSAMDLTDQDACCADIGLGVACVSFKQAYGAYYGGVMGKNGMLFTDPTYPSTGIILRLNVTDFKVEYFDLPRISMFKPNFFTNQVYGIRTLPSGTFFAEAGGHVIRQFLADDVADFSGKRDKPGDNVNVKASKATWNNPTDLGYNPRYMLMYVTDRGNSAIKRIQMQFDDGMVTLVVKIASESFYGIVTLKDYAFVVSPTLSTLHKVNCVTGKYYLMLDSRVLKGPIHMSLDQSEWDLYVADRAANQVVIYSLKSKTPAKPYSIMNSLGYALDGVSGVFMHTDDALYVFGKNTQIIRYSMSVSNGGANAGKYTKTLKTRTTTFYADPYSLPHGLTTYPNSKRTYTICANVTNLTTGITSATTQCVIRQSPYQG
eukprot:PhF_6_TR31879/c0_g3_i4/m.47377